MKLIIINASPRKNGATAKILTAFAEQLTLCGTEEATIYHLSDLTFDYCKGCCICYKTGECIMQDDAERLSQAIASCDGLIIGTPNYAGNVSGQLKTFIDRGHFVIEQLLKGKHTIGVVTYENAEGGAVYKVLRKLLVFSGTQTVDKLIVKLPFGSDPLAMAKIDAEVKKKAKRLYQAIFKAKCRPLIDGIIHYCVFHFGIKPLVMKKGDNYAGVVKHWERRGV